MKIKKFEDIIVWQKSQDLAVTVYQVTKQFSDRDLKSQYRRAVVSISNNIAEGFDRSSGPQFRQFINYALGSCGEVKSMVYLIQRLEFVAEEKSYELIRDCTEISKMLNGLKKSIGQ